MMTTLAEVFPPGEYLRDELDARGWTQDEFAEIIGRSQKQVNELLSGRASLTAPMAQVIAAALGTSADVWLGMENAYRLSLVEPISNDVERRAKLREHFPIREIQKRGWVQRTKSVDELESAVFSFYGVTSMEEPSPLACAAKRADDYGHGLSRVQEALLIRIRDLARNVQAKAYKEEVLRSRMDEFRALLSAPEEVRHVPKLLAECGIRFVVCEAIAGSKLDGVCTWLDAKSPVIGMTLRLDRIDNFWFVLRHEMEHVLRKDGLVQPIIDDDLDGRIEGGSLPAEELAANVAASEFLIPERTMQNWIDRVSPLFSKERILGFSALHQVHPGIVVGQLQHRLKRWDLFRPLLVKVRHLLMPVAMTDGYGHVIAN